jgi:hypothetical protein
MDRFAFLRAMLPARRDDAGRSGTGGSKLLFSGASCFFDEDGRVLYFAPTPQASGAHVGCAVHLPWLRWRADSAREKERERKRERERFS